MIFLGKRGKNALWEKRSWWQNTEYNITMILKLLSYMVIVKVIRVNRWKVGLTSKYTVDVNYSYDRENYGEKGCTEHCNREW